MDRFWLDSVDRFFTRLAGVLLIAGGAALIGAAMIMPAWLECRELAWQRDCLRLQAQRLEAQQVSYQDYLAALQKRDPVLLQRLAFTYFGLKPQGTLLLLPPPDNRVLRTADYYQALDMASPPQGFLLGNVDQWLSASGQKPISMSDFPPYRPLRTRLVRWTTGPTRLATIGLGVVLLLLAFECTRKRVPQRAHAAPRQPPTYTSVSAAFPEAASG